MRKRTTIAAFALLASTTAAQAEQLTPREFAQSYWRGDNAHHILWAMATTQGVFSALSIHDDWCGPVPFYVHEGADDVMADMLTMSAKKDVSHLPASDAIAAVAVVRYSCKVRAGR